MSERPTWTYDGSIPWLSFVQSTEQVLRDAIRDRGIEVRIVFREQPYSHPWYLQGSGRFSLTADPGVTFAKVGDELPRFTIQSATPKTPPVGIMELRGIRSLGVGGVAVAITRGHALLDHCEIDGIGPDGELGGPIKTGGDTGIFGSKHKGGEEKYIVLRDTICRNRGSHITYLEGSIVVVEGGEYDAARGGYDGWRCIADVFVAKGVKFRNTRLPQPDRNRYSSYTCGAISIQRAYYEDCLFERHEPLVNEGPYMVGLRNRQGAGGSDCRWVGDAPGPDDDLKQSDPRWAYFGPYRMDAEGHVHRPVDEDPRFWGPDYWEVVRAAGVETPEQLMANPHLWQHVFRRCRWVNHGKNGVGILAEGTAPIAAPTWREVDEARGESIRQDDYIVPLPPGWIERSHAFVTESAFESDGDAADPFVRFVGRDASKFVPRKTGAALEALSGVYDPSRSALSQVILVEPDASWLPQSVALDRMRHVFPEYADRYAETIWRP